MGIVVNETMERLKNIHESDKIAEGIRQLTSTVKLQAELDPNYFSHESMTNLISQHKAQLLPQS